MSSTSAAKAIFAPDSKRRRHGHANVAVSALDYYTQVLSDHLLKELDRPGRDTSTEVNQINWSYKQVKKNLQGPV
ncbi:hypothetical protein DPMN_062783 [Dreissena polymorpha]|uniref:Uncharacterized protein n=1 Tax=Dreissena polymorpha TaxID=45954 RepID=A0A9D4HJK0_DREPO|nr:hypothetical protein DPMN_062783 [Dreissena polymorpha]